MIVRVGHRVTQVLSQFRPAVATGHHRVVGLQPAGHTPLVITPTTRPRTRDHDSTAFRTSWSKSVRNRRSSRARTDSSHISRNSRRNTPDGMFAITGAPPKASYTC